MVPTKYLISTLSILAAVAAVPVPQDEGAIADEIEDIEVPEEYPEPPEQEDADLEDTGLEKRCFMGLCNMFGGGSGGSSGGGGGSIDISGGGSTSSTGSTGSSMSCGTSGSSSCSSTCTTSMSCAMLKIKRTIFARV